MQRKYYRIVFYLLTIVNFIVLHNHINGPITSTNFLFKYNT